MPGPGRPFRRIEMACDVHGQVAWRGDIRCERCGRVFLQGPSFIDLPDRCPCGADLLPPHPGAPFSGRPACPVCAQGQGPPPEGPPPSPDG